MGLVADDPEQRHAGSPRATVALADQLPVDAQVEARDVGVRDEGRDAGAGVVADLQQCVDIVRAQVEDVPGLEPRARRQPVGVDVLGVPAAVVVEDDDLVRAGPE